MLIFVQRWPVLVCLTTWLSKCVLAGGVAVAAACTVFATSRRVAPGRARLARVAPVLALFTILPLVFDRKTELLSRANCSALALWLANFKLLLFALGRGPLVDPTLHRDQFVALLLWPVLHTPSPDGQHVLRCPDSKPAQHRTAAVRRLFWRLPENLLITFISFKTLVSPHVPLFLKTYSAAFGVACYCNMLGNAVAALVIFLHGLEISPSWDRPWLQNSLSDFWSRRWNLPAAYTLRTLVYEPILEGRAVRKAKDDHTGMDINNNAQAITTPIAAAPAGPTQTTGKHTTVLNNGHHLTPAAADTLRPSDAPTEATLDTACPTLDSDQSTIGTIAVPAVAKGQKRPRVSAGRRLAALTAVFAVSGLMHEVLLLVCTGWEAYRLVAGKLMLYFMLQVPASLVEQHLAKTFKAMKWTPPDWIAIPITSLSLQVPGLFLFWDPMWSAATYAMTY